jgi:hypothetical protein
LASITTTTTTTAISQFDTSYAVVLNNDTKLAKISRLDVTNIK